MSTTRRTGDLSTGIEGRNPQPSFGYQGASTRQVTTGCHLRCWQTALSNGKGAGWQVPGSLEGLSSRPPFALEAFNTGSSPSLVLCGLRPPCGPPPSLKVLGRDVLVGSLQGLKSWRTEATRHGLGPRQSTAPHYSHQRAVLPAFSQATSGTKPQLISPSRQSPSACLQPQMPAQLERIQVTGTRKNSKPESNSWDDQEVILFSR